MKTYMQGVFIFGSVCVGRIDLSYKQPPEHRLQELGCQQENKGRQALMLAFMMSNI
jgi:hypothetical protein